MGPRKSIALAAIVAGIAGFFIGFDFGGKSIATFLNEMDVRGEAARTKTIVEHGRQLREGDTVALQSFYDADIACAPSGLNTLIQLTDEPKTIAKLEQAIAEANAYIEEYAIDDCRSDQ